MSTAPSDRTPTSARPSTLPTAGTRTGLLEFTSALAGQLPGEWTHSRFDLTDRTAKTYVDEQLWDLGLAHGSLMHGAHERAGRLQGPGDRDLVVLARPGPHRNAFLVAALLPPMLGVNWDHEDLAPHGIAVPADAARAAARLTTRLLPRLDVALGDAVAREIAAYTPSMSELAGDRTTARPPEPAVDLPDIPSVPPMVTSPLSSVVLRDAARELLDLIWESVFEDDVDRLSEAVIGGGDFICQTRRLPESAAPLIEAEAIGLTLNAAGLHPRGPSDPRWPAMVATLDVEPLEEQRALVRLAARPQLSTGSGRVHAAVTRTIPPAPRDPANPADRPPPVPLPNRTSLPGR
ncbi:hypothetical protein P3T36_003377 [Kitasatospora sp. MAP12-15]|uniref:hypothetical protein n=1 Tax=unclassified Kitasatospora TaxID=2633591 RepID=UPI002474E6D9|nr:hypothetical protein [Kitasatospora sp. MAP12-44]MDH6111354.1 hypothetical protein [Kitasatospora sp. MAP12-44]